MSKVVFSILKFTFPMPVADIPTEAAVNLMEKAWQKVLGTVGDLASTAGTKVLPLNAEGAVRDMIAGKDQDFEVYAAAGKDAFGIYWKSARSIRVLTEGLFPVNVEEMRKFYPRLNSWSFKGKKLFTDADLKQFIEDYPPKPKVYKTFEEMWKKDDKATFAFRSWTQKKGGKASKAYEDVRGKMDLKEKDPERVAALKAVNEVLKEYYKSF